MSNKFIKNTQITNHFIFPSTNLALNTIDIIPPLPLDKSINNITNNNPLYQSISNKNNSIIYGYFSPRKRIEDIFPSDIPKRYSPHPIRPRINIVEKEPKDRPTRKKFQSDNFIILNNNSEYISNKRPLNKISSSIKFKNEFEFFEKIPTDKITHLSKRNNSRKEKVNFKFNEKAKFSPYNSYKSNLNLNKKLRSNNNTNFTTNIKKNANFKYIVNIKNKKRKKVLISYKKDPTDKISQSKRNNINYEKEPLDSAKIDLEKNTNEDIGKIAIKEQKEIKLKNSLNINNNCIKKNDIINEEKKNIKKRSKKFSQDNVKLLNRSENKILKFEPLSLNTNLINNVNNRDFINKEQINNLLTHENQSDNNKIMNGFIIKNDNIANNNNTNIIREERKNNNYNKNKKINVNIKINDKNNIYRNSNINKDKDMVKIDKIIKINDGLNEGIQKSNHLIKSQQIKSINIVKTDMNKLNKNITKINNKKYKIINTKKSMDDANQINANKEDNLKEDKANSAKIKEEKSHINNVKDEETKNKGLNEINKEINKNEEKPIIEKVNVNREKEKISENDSKIQNSEPVIENKEDIIIKEKKIINNIEINSTNIKEIKKEEIVNKEKKIINQKEITKDIEVNKNIKNNIVQKSNKKEKNNTISLNNVVSNNNILDERNKGNYKNKNSQKSIEINKIDNINENVQENIINENKKNNYILKNNKNEVKVTIKNENNAQIVIENNNKTLQKDLEEKKINKELMVKPNENMTEEKNQNNPNIQNNIKEKAKLDKKNEISQTKQLNENIKKNKSDKDEKLIESEPSDTAPKENNNLDLGTNVKKKPLMRKLTPKVHVTDKMNQSMKAKLDNINPNAYSDKKKLNHMSEDKKLLIKSTQLSNFNKIRELFKLEKSQESFNPNDFIYINIIGEGEFGKIYLAQNKTDNQYYAMKIEVFKRREEAKKSQMITKIIKDFLQKTNSQGVIKIYGDICLKNNDLFNYYVLMERAERDMEQELIIRCINNQFYNERDITNVLCQLILTLSEMQKNHIAQRDIKPQNIVIIKGRYKISDFGEAIVLGNNEDEGNLVLSISGTELYMSPIVFFAMRNKCEQVKHNVYKSDVFSLGMCILLGATLNYDSLCQIREVTDMNEIHNVLMYYLSARYSNIFISFLYKMLEVDESKRPDFIQLENMLVKRK